MSEISTTEVEALFELLQRHCLLGQAHYRMWRGLNVGFGESPEVGNLAPTFFYLLAEAQLNSALLILNRLIDRKSNTLSIYRFLDMVSASAEAFPHSPVGKIHQTVADDKLAFSGADATVKRIRDHRNQQFIRLSERIVTAPEKVTSNSDSFAFQDIYALLVRIGELLNRYRGYFKRTEMLMEFGDEKSEFGLVSI